MPRRALGPHCVLLAGLLAACTSNQPRPAVAPAEKLPVEREETPRISLEVQAAMTPTGTAVGTVVASGTLLATLATYSNLNKGTAGVYSQKSLSVAAYKGQTVRIQFRNTTDSSLSTTFRVDTVSVK